MLNTTTKQLELEFERQVNNLIQLNYPKSAKLSNSTFVKLLEPLKASLLTANLRVTKPIPFLIVTKSSLVSSEEAMEKIAINNQIGVVNMTPVKPTDFNLIEQVEIPNSAVYLITNVDTGKEFLNVSPEESLTSILKQNRTPLTLDEGVALVTHFPESLTDKKRFNAIQMPGSRIENDQRVPSIWISKKEPRLGWCWNRNIHTWLGSASGEQRLN